MKAAKNNLGNEHENDTNKYVRAPINIAIFGFNHETIVGEIQLNIAQEA